MTTVSPIIEPTRWQRHLGFPLLAKELAELANRRRTYVIRFVYAAVLFGIGLFAIAGGSSTNVRLGAGRDIFFELVRLQFWLVLIFLPATASGALTMEKERDSLALLLLTTIPPWSIILQKYLSRLIPMLSFLLLGLPLMAAAYSYGGVATGELIGAIGLLMLFAVQVAAVALACSSYCRTTGEAFVLTYVVLAVLSLFHLSPQVHMTLLSGDGGAGVSGHVAVLSFSLILTSMITISSLVSAAVMLAPRAFVPPRNVLLQLFQRLDAFYNEMNHVTGGVVLIDDRNELPDQKPIAWRETSKKSLGTARYLFRVLTLLEVPILFVATSVNIDMVRDDNAVTRLLDILWVISAAMLCVHASGVVTSERSRQTLDTLLTTPLTGAEILKQKMSGVRRLIVVLLVPFSTIYAFQLWFRGFNWGYAVGAFGTALIFLPLVAWGALWIGLHLQSTMKAVLTSMFTVLVICAAPLVAEAFLGRWTQAAEWVGPNWIGSLSPVSIIRGVEDRGSMYQRMNELRFWLLIGPLPLYGMMFLLIRQNCLRNADRLLRRVPEDPTAPIDPFNDTSVQSTNVGSAH
ncbi:MAG: hypothetical protein KF861_09770 [Planctomycetaceae bacterium]|nr:hypothetical protein [Planctomycetaceae bacterium]